MKKIIAAAIAVTILAGFTGCAEDKSPAVSEITEAVLPTETESETKAETEAAANAETTASSAETAKEVTTTAETETETETEAESESETQSETVSGTEAETASEAEGDTLTEKVMNKLGSWSAGNIIIEVSMEEDGMAYSIVMNSYGGKAFVDMDITGLFRTTTISDGTKTYIIRKQDKTYCLTSDISSEGEESIDSLIMDKNKISSMKGTGKENIDGKEYTYEEFENDGEILRYYFDSKNELCYIGGNDTDGNMQYVDFKVKFLSSPDESVFEIPDDYTEVTEDEMSAKMMSELFGAMEAASDESGESGSE